jgi:predicted  nucleic acid-binding Zn-ribbon protein
VAGEADFKCLRCGAVTKMPYQEGEGPKERACPKCKSNSVRRVKEKKEK